MREMRKMGVVGVWSPNPISSVGGDGEDQEGKY